MIAAQPTKKDLQTFWEQDPLAFHTSPMPGFEGQELSAAQWALLTQPTPLFWEDKSHPQDSGLWSWAVDNAREGVATIDMMARLGIPTAPDTLVRLLLRSAASEDKIKIAYATMSFAAKHHSAWTTEKDKTTAPELLASSENIAYLTLLDTKPELLSWKKMSTGNGLLHSAILYKSKATIAVLLQKGASQEPNNAGVTPVQMAHNELVAWPSTFGKTKDVSTTKPNSESPVSRARKPSSASAGTTNSEQIGLF